MNAEKWKYENVRIALLDPSTDMRRLIKSALGMIGLRQVDECKSLIEVSHHLANKDMDLLIMDIDADTRRGVLAIRDIRNEQIGANPFLVIMALCGLPNRTTVSSILEAGADDVVIKPVSAQILMERIANLISNRKEFRVTTDYVGPSRPANDGLDLPTIAVPNTLRHKATGDETAKLEPETLKKATREIKIHQVFSIADDISDRAAILEDLASRNSGRVSSDLLRQLSDRVVRLNGHIVGNGLESLTEIGKSMGDVMGLIVKSAKPVPRQFEILRLHGQAVGVTIKSEDSARDIVADALAEAATLLKARGRKPMTASQKAS